jgi:hypothetical protein
MPYIVGLVAAAQPYVWPLIIAYLWWISMRLRILERQNDVLTTQMLLLFQSHRLKGNDNRAPSRIYTP